jgi:hypothetical protein
MRTKWIGCVVVLILALGSQASLLGQAVTGTLLGTVLDSTGAAVPNANVTLTNDADDIKHEWWNSIENAVRDDCNNYAKTAPPTIANGRVYLASFGTRNAGSAQLCVYGLLPDGGAPLAPSTLNATAGDGQVQPNYFVFIQVVSPGREQQEGK